MIKKHILAGLSFLVAASLLMVACSPQSATTEAPTVDANMIYTQAAQTVQAAQALTEAVQAPTQTPTEAAAPTFTMDPAMAAALTATANAVLQPGLAVTVTPGGPTLTVNPQITPLVLPTATKAAPPPAAATGDRCEWVSNYPTDNSQIPRNASFDASIKVKNSGTTTWDNQYKLRYYAGERMGVPSDYAVQHAVKPNETYQFIFTMTAPDSTGNKEVLLVVQNPDGRNMCFINIPLEIVD